MNNASKQLLIGTHNKAKYAEMSAYLASQGFNTVSLADLGITYDVPETGATYEENALLKAQAYSRLSGLPTVVDDGGLEIRALNGEPGVHSARYAGPDATDMQKVSYVLEKMKHVPLNERDARFFTIVAYALPNGTTTFYSGECPGRITTEPRGTLAPGFPYRLIFLIPEVNKTLAELGTESKKYTTHRLQALEKFVNALR